MKQLGDGAGVGKGRTVAGVIYENWILGRTKSIWISVSNDLKEDAERDLKDITAHGIKVHHLKNVSFYRNFEGFFWPRHIFFF